AAVRSAVARRAKRIRFRDQKITAPHTDRCEGRLFPPEQSWKSSTVLNQRGPAVVGLSGLLLTASSVITVMPACMLTVPNPGSRSEWPTHCEGGIHYVWPCKLGAELALVIFFVIAAHVLRKWNKAARQH